jgi:hypothetical protein
VLKTSTIKLTVSPSKFLLIIILVLLLPKMNLYGQEREGIETLSDKMNEIVDNVEEIHSILRNIVVTVNNEGVPGWDKILIAVDIEQGAIQNTRDKINTLTDLLEHNTFPFPSALKTDAHTIKIDTQGVFSKGWKFSFPSLKGTYPNFPTPFPNAAEKINSFLDLIDQPLTGLKDELMDFDSELDSRLMQAKSNLNYNQDTPFADSLYADYFYGEFIRNWIGHPAIVLASALVKEKAEALSKKCRAITQQDIAIVGEGGNLSFIMVALSHLFSIWDLVNAFIQNIPSNSTGAEVTASYFRLDHLNSDIEIAQDSINSHIADFQIWKAFSLRTRIEINLAGHGDHPHPIAIFQLPAQFGGYLELARDIVQETINNMLSAGENVYQAQVFFSRGNDELVASHYKKAYKWYSKSYNEATK